MYKTNNNQWVIKIDCLILSQHTFSKIRYIEMLFKLFTFRSHKWILGKCNNNQHKLYNMSIKI